MVWWRGGVGLAMARTSPIIGEVAGRPICTQFHETAVFGIESSGGCTLITQKFSGLGWPARENGAQNFMQHKASSNYLIQPYSSRSNCERVDR